METSEVAQNVSNTLAIPSLQKFSVFTLTGDMITRGEWYSGVVKILCSHVASVSSTGLSRGTAGFETN